MILVGIGTVFGLAGAYFWGSPRLVSVSPSPDASSVSANAALQLTFSRPIQPQSVQDLLVIDPPVEGTVSAEGRTVTFTPSRPWPEGSTVHVNLPPGARLAGILPLPVRQETAWEFRVAFPRLAFLVPAGELAGVWIVNPSTGESEPLLRAARGVLEFDIDSQGQMLFFSTPNRQGGSDLYRYNLQEPSDAAEPDLLLACGDARCRAPQVSPGRDFLAYERIPPPSSGEPPFVQVWMLPLDVITNTVDTQPARIGAADHQTSQPQWSPGGLLTFYDTQAKAYTLFNPKTGETVLFPNETGQQGTWEPLDTAYIAPEIFVLSTAVSITLTGTQEIAISHLIRYEYPGGAQQDLSRLQYVEDTTPAFSPDGLHLAFARKYLDAARWTPGRQLWLSDADGAQALPLTDAPDYNHYYFAWNSASTQIAFVRFNETNMITPPEIWLFDLQTNTTKELVKEGYAPQWIP